MATIKSYSDLQQSKKLAEILPIESADMYYPWYIEEDRDNIKSGHRISIPSVGNFIHKVNILPCWSLASLIGVLPEKYTELIKEGGMYRIIIKDSYMTSLFYNPVDACYEMILKLHELNLL